MHMITYLGAGLDTKQLFFNEKYLCSALTTCIHSDIVVNNNVV